MDIRTILNSELNIIGRDIKKALVNELMNQKHIATGKLAATTKHKVNVSNSEAEVRITSKAKYWSAIDNGTRPHSPPFDRIMQWIDDKGISYANEAEKARIATAIIRRIEIEGTPTKGSFARTGATHRTDYINRAINPQKSKIKKRLQKAIGDNIKVQSTKTIKKANQDG